jgi:cytochrome b561
MTGTSDLFGIPMPFLFAEPNAALARRIEGPHKLLSYLLLIVIVIHVAAALRHHFIKRNDVLRRMVVG